MGWRPATLRDAYPFVALNASAKRGPDDATI
jgi:hypothetical protein